MANNRDGSGRFKPGVSGNQAGRPRKQDAALQAAVDDALARRGDGWGNVISAFGNAARDKRMGWTFCADQIGDEAAQELWRGDPVAARAVEVWPTEMLRAGWEICVPESEDKERAEDVAQICEDLELDDALIEAMTYQRAYGGGAILMGIQDGRAPSEPVNEATVNSIDWLTTLEPREIQPKYWYANPLAPKFGQVELWQVTPQTQGTSRDFSFGSTIDIHESRLLVFNGTRVSRIQHGERAFWGDSVFTRLFATLRDFNSIYSSLGVLMNELGTPVWEVDNLAQMVTAKDSSLLKNRVMAMDFCKSVIRAVVIAKGEIYRRDTMTFAGVPEILDRFAQKLSAALDGMPLTMLLGISPTGLGSTGESEIEIFHKVVAAKQKKFLRKPLQRFLRLLWQGKPPKKWSIEFAPLSQPTDKETADTRKTAMDTAVAAVNAQILTPEEARQSMFGGDKYSMEIQLDPTLTAPEDFQEPPEPVVPGVPPGGAGGTPPPEEAAAAELAEMDAEDEERADAFDPDQPRDEHGQWSASGALAASISSETASRKAFAEGRFEEGSRHAKEAAKHKANYTKLAKKEAAKKPAGKPAAKPKEKKPKPEAPKDPVGTHEEENAKANEKAAQAKEHQAAGRYIEALRLTKEARVHQANATKLAKKRTDWDPDQPRDESGRFGEGGGASRLVKHGQARIAAAEHEANLMAEMFEREGPAVLEEVYGKGVTTREAAVETERVRVSAEVAKEEEALKAGHIAPVPSEKLVALEREIDVAASRIEYARRKLETHHAEAEKAVDDLYRYASRAGSDDAPESGDLGDSRALSQSMAESVHDLSGEPGDAPDVSGDFPSRDIDDDDSDPDEPSDEQVAAAKDAYKAQIPVAIAKVEALHNTQKEAAALLKDRSKALRLASAAALKEATSTKPSALVKVAKGTPERPAAYAAAKSRLEYEVTSRESAGDTDMRSAILDANDAAKQTAAVLKALRKL